MADAEAKMQEARVQCLVVMDDQQIVRGIVQIFQPVS
jgi:CBS domain-containing protein